MESKKRAVEYIHEAESWLEKIYRWLGLALEIIRSGEKRDERKNKESKDLQ